MNESDIRYLIQQEIARSMNVILTGTSKGSAQLTESIQSFVPGAPTLVDRPLYQPFGFASQSPDGTPCLVARIGTHPAARYVVGHRDPNKPNLAGGEAAVYSVGGMIVRVYNDKVQVGNGESYQTVVCGELLTTLLTNLISLIAAHEHLVPSLGTSGPPVTAASFTALAAGDNLLAKKGGGL